MPWMLPNYSWRSHSTILLSFTGSAMFSGIILGTHSDMGFSRGSVSTATALGTKSLPGLKFSTLSLRALQYTRFTTFTRFKGLMYFFFLSLLRSTCTWFPVLRVIFCPSLIVLSVKYRQRRPSHLCSVVSSEDS